MKLVEFDTIDYNGVNVRRCNRTINVDHILYISKNDNDNGTCNLTMVNGEIVVLEHTYSYVANKLKATE